MSRSLSVEETVDVKLISSGERDRLKNLARERLQEAGWTDEVKRLCREYASFRGPDNVTHEDLVEAVKPQARAKVPDSLKAELLRRIRGALES